MRVFRKKDNKSLLYESWNRHEWWIQDEDMNWWYSNHDMLGQIYQWTYYSTKIPVVYMERLYESSELAFLVTTGSPISDTYPIMRTYHSM